MHHKRFPNALTKPMLDYYSYSPCTVMLTVLLNRILFKAEK